MMNTASWCKAFESVVLLLLAMTAASVNGQGIIISITGPPDPNPRDPTTGGFSGHLGATPLGVSWTAGDAFSDISLSILLDANAGATGTAYLTTSVGPGTSTADEIASASFVFPSTPSLVPVLSGFTLEGGTYFLIIQQTASGSNGDGTWLGTPSPSVTSAANVTANAEYKYGGLIQSYPPACTFIRISPTCFQYTATGSPVPEPSAPWLILLAGGVAMLGRVRKRIGCLR